MNPLGALGLGQALTGIDLGALFGSILKDLLSQLLAKNDQHSMKTMKDLSEHRDSITGGAQQNPVASSPMPYSQSAAAAAQPNAGGNHTQVYGVVISQQDSTVVPRKGGRLHEVSGSDSDWQNMANEAKEGLTGSPQAQERILHGGKNPWDTSDGNRDERVAVLWAMQQNPNVRYDADKKEFFTQGADGSRKKTCDLKDVIDQVNKNGGFNPNNGAGLRSVGDLMNGKIDASPSQSTTVSVFRFQFDQAFDQLKTDDSKLDVGGQMAKAKKIHEKFHAIDEGVAAMQPMLSYTQTNVSASVSA